MLPVFLLALLRAEASDFEASDFDEKMPIGVLYAGRPGSPREREWVRFLSSYFATVRTADYERFRDADPDGLDVVILDWPSRWYPEDGPPIRRAEPEDPEPPRLSMEYARPTILVGAVGGIVADKLRLKLDASSFSLGDAAHGMAASHDIFRSPLRVEPTYEVREASAAYKGEPGPTIRTWRVQAPGLDPGIAYESTGFLDSPDCEVIACGLNEEGPGHIAIGRQACFLGWGFPAGPSEMTEEARRCFVNAVCYMAAFDGQKPLVHRVAPGREFAFAVIRRMETEGDSRLYRDWLPEAEERFGDDAGRAKQYVKENLEFLRVEGDTFQVDQDVKGLGVSNRNLSLLDVCVGMLERGRNPELAMRVLLRYTTENFTGPKEWRKWLDEGRTRRFISDVGGYKFLVAPESSRRKAGGGREEKDVGGRGAGSGS